MSNMEPEPLIPASASPSTTPTQSGSNTDKPCQDPYPLDDEQAFLLQAYTNLRQRIASLSSPTTPILPTASAITGALGSLSKPRDASYLQPHGKQATHAYLLDSILPALNRQSLSPRYFGFVTGGVIPIAEAADNLVSASDQNVQVHFDNAGDHGRSPAHSASTAVEDAALGMLVDLLELGPGWEGRTFTTGATAGNILGLACGREAIIAARLPPSQGSSDEDGGQESVSVGEMGLLAACRAAGVRDVRVLTNMGHSSLGKAASVVGLGRASVIDVGMGKEGMPWRLDLDAVEKMLREGYEDGVASVVVVSAGEVNTGYFATGALDMPKLRSLADRYKAWIHVDGAFGIFARCLPKTDEFLALHAHVAGLELADSIAADAHKLLNVPYDAGIFFCRSVPLLTQVFQNPNAAYLSSPPSSNNGHTIPSPLNIGLENSRRFRALPIYAVLRSEGRAGLSDMFARMVHLARHVAAYVRDSAHYEWLPSPSSSLESTFIIVLFRARDPSLNEVLVNRINGTGKMFVSGTSWEGHKAVRIAVSNWRVSVEIDGPIIREVLDGVVEEWKGAK